jgi:predicted nucleic acid-binding Zn ribbon protein
MTAATMFAGEWECDAGIRVALKMATQTRPAVRVQRDANTYISLDFGNWR